MVEIVQIEIAGLVKMYGVTPRHFERSFYRFTLLTGKRFLQEQCYGVDIFSNERRNAQIECREFIILCNAIIGAIKDGNNMFRKEWHRKQIFLERCKGGCIIKSSTKNSFLG